MIFWKKISKYFHPISVIQKRIVRKQLWSIGFFIALSVSFFIASLIFVNQIRFIEANIVSVERQILATPILIIILLISLFLGLSISVSVSREYDKGTLELLLYGPVDEAAFILGNFWAQFKILALALLGVFIWSNLIVWIFNLYFSLNILLILAAGLSMALEIIAFGLLSAILGGKTRGALIFFILVLVIFAGVEIGDSIVANLLLVTGSTAVDPLIFLRDILENLNNIFRWISPYAQMQNCLQALSAGVLSEFAFLLGLMIIEAVLLLGLCIWILTSRGVRTSS